MRSGERVEVEQRDGESKTEKYAQIELPAELRLERILYG